MLTEETLRAATAEVQQYLAETVPEDEAEHPFSADFEKKIKNAIRWKRIRKWIPGMFLVAMVLVLLVCAQFSVPDTLWQEPLSDADKTHLYKVVREQCCIDGGWIDWGDHYEYENPYYGMINHCVVVRVEYPVDMGISNFGYFEAAGYTFYWVEVPELYAYRDGELCRLDEAYEKGWLTKTQIGMIYEKHEEYISMMPEEYQAYFRAWIEKIEQKKNS